MEGSGSKQHASSKKKPECPACGKLVWYLENHVRAVHLKEKDHKCEPATVHLGEKDHKCGKAFT